MYKRLVEVACPFGIEGHAGQMGNAVPAEASKTGFNSIAEHCALAMESEPYARMLAGENPGWGLHSTFGQWADCKI
ncbi:hypothetical protein [Agrobacterium tumefaciens]|uniref:hypothetical protein n=1 Tax=Agrobacterium tumefaciens TaxID=358 RepID=UPI0004594532|nr:hypothetical protein [Agrobacterium tumefaciens]CDN94966.1 hypothetical protein BN949_04138 [Agrobacterium tumefaciens]